MDDKKNNSICVENPKETYFESSIFNNKLQYYHKLQIINLTQCDLVPDCILWIFKLLYPQINIYNYYAEPIEFQ